MRDRVQEYMDAAIRKRDKKPRRELPPPSPKAVIFKNGEFKPDKPKDKEWIDAARRTVKELAKAQKEIDKILSDG